METFPRRFGEARRRIDARASGSGVQASSGGVRSPPNAGVVSRIEYRERHVHPPQHARLSVPPPVTVRLSKGKDARDLLVCERADGTSTWRRVSDGMPVHDLAHLAVESTLGLEDAFYGLVADGWSIESFAEPGTSRRLPGLAVWTEVVVFLLQTEVANGIVQDTSSFNATVAAISGSKHVSYNRHISPSELDAIRTALRGWCDEWKALTPGEELAFRFVPGTEGLERQSARDNG